jgi:hypothetical protein
MSEQSFWLRSPTAAAVDSVAEAVAHCQVPALEGVCDPGIEAVRAWDDAKFAENKVQCQLLRDIFGDPSRPLQPIDPSLLIWNDGAVLKLAQAAYDERRLPSGELDPGRLAVLADALEEAGESDEQLLRHLRSAGPHVRGCVAVDAVLEARRKLP